MIATNETARPAVLVGRLDRDKLLQRLSLGCALLVSAILNLWNLSQNGYGNEYYATAVQSMLQNWHNFFFAAYDAGGYITVDKPPVALWMQAISAKIFGFSGPALLVPEALAGVASVALLYFLVKRIFGPLAGFMAALALALNPIAVAVERSNNTDTWLMFTLLLAAWAITRATEKGAFRLLALSMALVGVAFNIKMLEAWIVLPTFFVLYLVAAPLSWKKRLVHLTLAGLIALSVSLSWAVAVDLTPASARPYIGGSQTNSVLELALGYNGLGRITGQGEGMGGGGTLRDLTRDDGTTQSSAQSGANALPGNFAPPAGAPGAAGNPGGGPGGGSFNTGTPGPLRLFNTELAAQWSWLFPLAGLGLVAAGLGVRRKRPLARRGQALLLWGGWLFTYGAVFSMASGIFHNYYLIMLAPAAAALAGAGIAALWAVYRRGGWRAWLLPAVLLATAAWQVKLLADYPAWSAWLAPLLLGGSGLAAGGLVVANLLRGRILRRVAPVLVGVGLLALLLAPAAWASTAVTSAGNGTIPTVGPSQTRQAGGFGGPMGQANALPGGDTANSGLISYLQANQDGYFYLVAVASANQASSIALSTGEPVLATGGFTGSDPALTVEKLQALVATRQVRYILLGGGGPGGSNSEITSWVQAHGTAVDASAYGGQSGSATRGGFGGPGGFGGGTLYDLSGAAG
jgi:4-amino-4-deoxy-L-arabinose transferase-like glycosyltransferase